MSDSDSERSGVSSNASLGSTSTAPSETSPLDVNKTDPGTSATTNPNMNTTATTNTNETTGTNTSTPTDSNAGASTGTTYPPPASSVRLTPENLFAAENSAISNYIAQNPKLINSILDAAKFGSGNQSGATITYTADGRFHINIGSVKQRRYEIELPDGSVVTVDFTESAYESTYIPSAVAIKNGYKLSKGSGALFPTVARPDIRNHLGYETPKQKQATTTGSSKVTSSAGRPPEGPFDIETRTVPLGSTDSVASASSLLTEDATKSKIYELLQSASEEVQKQFKVYRVGT